MYRHYSKTLALSFFNAVTHFVDMLRCPVPTVDPFYSCFILLGLRHLPRKQCSWLHEVARCPEQHRSCSRRRRAALSFVAPPLAVAKEKKKSCIRHTKKSYTMGHSYQTELHTLDLRSQIASRRPGAEVRDPLQRRIEKGKSGDTPER